MFFSGCGGRPSYILSEKKMENVLFDLYIADIEIKENQTVFKNDSTRKQQLLNSVLKKHRITEQTFDTSLFWYNANLELYLKINDRLIERYTRSIENLQKEKENLINRLTIRDTTFLYRAEAFRLQSLLRENIHVFQSDTFIFDEQKKYDLEFFALGIKDTIKPILTFCIQCSDTNIVHRDTIAHNGRYTTQYSAPSYSKVESIYGYLYLPYENKHPVFIAYFNVFQQKITILPMDEITKKIGIIK
jgi:hypothetical protein